MQTLSVILSLICRVVLVGFALSGFWGHVSGGIPGHISQEWGTIAACDLLAVLAPLTRWRNTALLAGLAAAGAHFWFRHSIEAWTLWYTGVAIVLVLLPRYMLKPRRFKAGMHGNR